MKNFNLFLKRISFLKKKLPGFTLTELLVVLAIIGILILLALPNLLPLITKAKTTEAKLQLNHLYTLEKNYFYSNSKYSASLADLDFIQEKLVSEGESGQANYKIEIINATNRTFLARATSITDFDGDGVYNVWEIDQEKNLVEKVKD